MSGAEEYLDGLLHSVEGGSPADTAVRRSQAIRQTGFMQKKNRRTKKAGMSEEDDFLKSFEADTDLEGDADTFIRQFEDELDQAPGEERTQKTTEENNQFFKDLDGFRQQQGMRMRAPAVQKRRRRPMAVRRTEILWSIPSVIFRTTIQI